KAVVAAASKNRILRTQRTMHHFERRAHVVIESADQPRLHYERNTSIVQIFLYRREMRFAVRTKVLQDRGQVIDDRLIFGNLAIEDTQRIGLRAALTIAT